LNLLQTRLQGAMKSPRATSRVNSKSRWICNVHTHRSRASNHRGIPRRWWHMITRMWTSAPSWLRWSPKRTLSLLIAAKPSSLTQYKYRIKLKCNAQLQLNGLKFTSTPTLGHSSTKGIRMKTASFFCAWLKNRQQQRNTAWSTLGRFLQRAELILNLQQPWHWADTYDTYQLWAGNSVRLCSQ
jgi:hypothetical protein